MTTGRVVIRSHAKINLSLEVLGVRADGYHELKTVFQSLALHDRLTFEISDGPFSLACRTPGVPTDSRNLVWRAAALLWERAGFGGELRGVGARILKRVPAQGGLGGGSANAAATLVALDRLWGVNLGPRRLRELAVRLGADVPFFLCGGTALGLDRGDEIYPLEDLGAYSVVLVFPPFGVPTPEAFAWFDHDLQDGHARRGGREAGEATPSRPVVRLAGDAELEVVNDLEGPVGRRHPEIPGLCRQLTASGADAAAMSGSGSTVFGLFADRERARAAASRLAGDGWRVLLTRTAGRRQVRPLPLTLPVV